MQHRLRIMLSAIIQDQAMELAKALPAEPQHTGSTALVSQDCRLPTSELELDHVDALGA